MSPFLASEDRPYQNSLAAPKISKAFPARRGHSLCVRHKLGHHKIVLVLFDPFTLQ